MSHSTFELNTAIKNGIVTMLSTNEADKYYLLIATKTQRCFIPVIKESKGYTAYLEDTDPKFSDLVEVMLQMISEDKTFSKSGINKISLRLRRHEEITKIITGVCTPNTGVKVLPVNFKNILESNGYTYAETSSVLKGKHRDYSKLLENPENKAMFDMQKEKLELIEATFEGLSLEAKIAYEAVNSGEKIGIIFEGPTGTGKSTMAEIMAIYSGAPYLRAQITDGTITDDLKGQFIPNESGEGGPYKFAIGQLLKAYEYGYPMIIEEVNFGQPGVIALLNQFTDGTASITIDDKTYYRHPGFVVYMTMNPGYEGTQPLNVALKNRFIKVNVPALNKKEFTARMMAYSGALGHTLPKKFFEKLYDRTAWLEKEGCGPRWHENVKYSIRNAQGLCASILINSKTREEFMAAFSVNYLNDFATDNDNSDKLEEFKKEEQVSAIIDELYAEYDLLPDVYGAELDDFGSLFATVEDPLDALDASEKEAAADKDGDDLIIDDLLSRFDE